MTTSDDSTAHLDDPQPVVTDDAVARTPESEDPTETGRRWPRWQAWAVFALYLAYWIHLSWPLFDDPNGILWGAVGDQTGFLSLYRELHQDGELGILPGTVGDFAAPEGLKYGWVNLFGQAASSLLVSGLFAVFSSLAAVAVYATIAIVGSAFAAFLLLRKLTGSPLAAVVAGFGFGFSTFLVHKSTGHLDFSHGWVFIVMLWRWLELMEHRTVRNAIFAGLGSLLAVAWTAYFALLALVLGLVLAAAFILRELRARKFAGVRRSLVLIAVTGVAPVLFIAASLYFAGNDPEAVIQPTRSLDELTVYAARPLDYLMPTQGTPFVGSWAQEWRANHMHGSNASENTLYVGWTVLLLALVGIITLLRDRPKRYLGFLAVAIALVAAWFSFPPLVGVGGVLIPTPSKFLFEVQPGFRVYSRFVVLVILALAVL
ncbi:MAG: hypothetical protein Q7T55_20605, partial [Solirubrobacteraceae bacterium]|nr:hypothetical protein [Solirubrobacteraceae bacterium]